MSKKLVRSPRIMGSSKTLKEWEDLINYYRENPITVEDIQSWIDLGLRPNALADTEHMNDENGQPTREWLNLRSHGPSFDDATSDDYLPFVFGGSGVSSFTNLAGAQKSTSPWNSAIDYFYQKTGRPFRYNVEENEAAKRAGHYFEAAVAKAAHEVDGYETLETYDDFNFYQHPVLPFICINIDKRVVLEGKRMLGEVKTTGVHNFEAHRRWKNGMIPVYYQIQKVIYESVLMEYDETLFMVKWGMTPDAGANVISPRNLEIEANVLNACVDFAYSVLYDIAPSWDTCPSIPLVLASLKRVYGYPNQGEETDFSGAMIDIIAEYTELNKKIKEKEAENKLAIKPFKDRLDKLEADIRIEMKTAEHGSIIGVDGKMYSVHRRLSTTNRVDTKKLKEAAKEDPTLLEYYKQTQSERIIVDVSDEGEIY